jgi:regulatory protein
MPRITDIQQQKNNPGRYSISIDDKYAFPLSANDLLAWGLHLNQELSEQELEELKTGAGQSKAYDQALNYLSLRKRSTKEVTDYLKRKHYETEVIDRTLARLVDNKLVDDLDFAHSWVNDRNILKPRSKRVLEGELRQKGVSREDIEVVLAEISADDQLQILRGVIAKKKTLAKYQDPQKLTEYLVRQGFDYYQVKQALEDN